MLKVIRNNFNDLKKHFFLFLPIVFVPASAQHNSSVLKSIASELGNCTDAPEMKTPRSVPSMLAHSILGDSRFQSDQNTFLEW